MEANQEKTDAKIDANQEKIKTICCWEERRPRTRLSGTPSNCRRDLSRQAPQNKRHDILREPIAPHLAKRHKTIGML
jgi:hypothetical protein